MADEKKAVVEEEETDIDPWDFDDPEGKVVAEAEPEALPPEDESGITEELIDRAMSAGITEEDLSNMGSKEQIEFVIGLLEGKEKDQKDEGEATIEDGEASGEGRASDDVSWIDDLDPDEAIDSDSARAVKAMKAKMDEMSTALRSMNKQNQSIKHEVLFSKLGDEWTELFGSDEEQSSKQASHRGSIVEEIETLKNGFRSRKRAMPDDAELFERAINSVFGSQVKDFARQELSDRLRKRESQFISRASTQTGGELLTGREKALSNVANKMRDLGFEVDEAAHDVFE